MSGPNRIEGYFRDRRGPGDDRPAGPDARAEAEAEAERLELKIFGAAPCVCGCDCGKRGVVVKHPTGAIWFGVPEALDAFVDGLRKAREATWPGEGS